MQDIEKLQKLSCLKVQEQQKDPLSKSINQAFDLLGEVQSIEISNEDKKILEEIHQKEVDFLLSQRKYLKKLQEKEEKSNLVTREVQTKGLLIEGSFFKAPQVLGE